MYNIYTTEEFNKKFSKLDKSIRTQIDKEIEKLQDNPTQESYWVTNFLEKRESRIIDFII